ncbi:MAG: T9SS type A sorting domain-containing protein [Bacteroidales bacterium]|nr:T9SS type A sorting domain-containing protein [Bacteroidales bacterium]MCF8337577.1 T9SS type A sorting domain-containing protein [Bacteroidales bacterium]
MKRHYQKKSKSFFSVYILVIFAFLSITSQAQSQVWIDDNAKWTYDFWNLGVEGTYEFEYTSDTMISGKLCQKIEMTCHKYFTHPNGYPVYEKNQYDPGFTYASGDSVFHYSNGQFHLLYDFSATVGDSWIVDIVDYGGNCNDTARVEVVATGTTEINGEELRTITLESASDSYVSISSTCVEKFGATFTTAGDVGKGPFPGIQSCGGSVMEPDILDLRCFSDDSFPVYNVSDDPCNHLTGVGYDFRFFTIDERKAFAHPELADTVYSIAFDTVYSEPGGVWVYENFKTFGDWIEPEECEFWGPPQCLPLNQPSWLGGQVTYDNNGRYTFYTLQDDSIQIDISLQAGDSALIYEDSAQRFYMKGLGEEVTEILGITDTVRKFRISHYDTEGNVINSDLQHHEIITGKKLGLISFFRIDHFPEMLLPLELVGNTEPETGLTKITYADIHDYQPGDVIQYKIKSAYAGGPPSENFTRYDKYRYIQREENSDTLFYTAVKTSFFQDSTTVTTDTVEMSYYKYQLIDNIPFGQPERNENQILRHERVYQENYCGEPLWTFESEQGSLKYCAADDCWGGTDMFGLPLADKSRYAFGLGLYSSYVSLNDGLYSKSIVYFDKGEYSCGEEVTGGMKEIPHFEDYFEIYPNPAKNRITLNNLKNMEGSFSISDTQGRTVQRYELRNGHNVIQIDHLKTGLYFIKVESLQKYTFQTKFVKR